MQSNGGRIKISISDFLLELHDDVDGHVQDSQLRLRLLRVRLAQRLEGHADAAQLRERVVDVANPHSLAGVVGHATVFLLDHADLRVGQIVGTLFSFSSAGRAAICRCFSCSAGLPLRGVSERRVGQRSAHGERRGRRSR